MTADDRDRLTRLLSLAAHDRADAREELFALVYDDLRRIAAGMFRAEREDHTLQPTAIVHEAWIRLQSDGLELANRAHFHAVAARAMRRLLIDHARRRGAAKRGEPGRRVTMRPDLPITEEEWVDVLELDAVLGRLAEQHERQARVAELRFLVGLDVEEVAEALGISEKTVRRDWRFARAWLRRELAGENPG